MTIADMGLKCDGWSFKKCMGSFLLVDMVLVNLESKRVYFVLDLFTKVIIPNDL